MNIELLSESVEIEEDETIQPNTPAELEAISIRNSLVSAVNCWKKEMKDYSGEKMAVFLREMIEGSRFGDEQLRKIFAENLLLFGSLINSIGENRSDLTITQMAMLNQQLAYTLYAADQQPMFDLTSEEIARCRRLACVLEMLKDVCRGCRPYRILYKGALAEAIFLDIITNDDRFLVKIPDFGSEAEINQVDLKGIDVAIVDQLANRLFLLDIKAMSIDWINRTNGDSYGLSDKKNGGSYFNPRYMNRADYTAMAKMLSEGLDRPMGDILFQPDRAIVGYFNMNLNSSCKVRDDSYCRLWDQQLAVKVRDYFHKIAVNYVGNCVH